MTKPVDAIVARLTALHPKRIDLSLDRVQRLLAALDHPERKLPPVIHVAGTNGKGSTIAFLRAILEAAGKRVHVYTSPHLVRFNERYRLGTQGDGILVSDDELSAALEECERANAGAPITVFEITTAVGMLLFARHPADVLLLEVGLGGRLDATNVVDNPLATIITPIAIDHTDFLGDTLDKIATEKAGILKRGTPAIIAAQARDALAVIERQAAQGSARRSRSPARTGPRPRNAAGWSIRTRRACSICRRRNFTAVISSKMPASPSRRCARSSRSRSRRPPSRPAWSRPTGRRACSGWRKGGLVELAPAGSELWLDGGHNPDGGRAIAAALADLEERVSRPLVLIVGMLASKDCAGFLSNFTGLARRMIAVPVPGAEKGLSAEAVADAARAIGLAATSRDNLEEALDAARKLDLDPPPRILITGSLYLAGEVAARKRHAADLKTKQPARWPAVCRNLIRALRPRR